MHTATLPVLARARRVPRQLRRAARASRALPALLLLLVLALLTVRALPAWRPAADTETGSREREATVAYFVQISASTLAQTPRLLRAIYHPGNRYALHFDRKIPEVEVYATLRQIFRDLLEAGEGGADGEVLNVRTVPSEVVTYRGITMTMNYLTGSNFLLADGDWDYFVNLSGADYPTAGQDVIRRLLGRVRDRNFVEWKPRATWAGFAAKRLGSFYVDTGLAKLHGGTTAFLDLEGRPVTNAMKGVANPLLGHIDFTVAKSSGWFILSRAFCEHLRGDSSARKLLALLSLSDASDEHFVATVLANGGARWGRSVVADNLRSIFFVAPNGSFARGADGVRSRQHPFWVDERDARGGWLFWRRLWERPAFFARKVRGDGSFRDRVDAEMLGIGRGVDRARVAGYEGRLITRFERIVGEADRERGPELRVDEVRTY